MNLIISLLVNAVAILISANLIPGVTVSSISTSLALAVVLGLLNTLVKPVLLLLTLPINILTLGLFTFVINLAILYFADALVPGFKLQGLISALLFSITLSIVTYFLHILF